MKKNDFKFISHFLIFICILITSVYSKNLIKNSDFNDGLLYWKCDTYDGAEAEYRFIRDGEFNITIADPGPEYWSVMLYQEDIPIQQGKTYTLRFDAWARNFQYFHVLVQKNAEPWIDYSQHSSFSINSNWKSFERTFTMLSATDLQASLNFELGRLRTNDIIIDNVVLVEHNPIQQNNLTIYLNDHDIVKITNDPTGDEVTHNWGTPEIQYSYTSSTPIKLTAINDNSFTFEHWKIEYVGRTEYSYSNPLPFSIVEDVEVTPVYERTFNSYYYAINAGGPEYTGPGNIVYESDSYYTGGNSYILPSDVPIDGTEDEPLYRSERWGNFRYDFPINSALHTVVLKFAEIYFDDPDARIFDVTIEGKKAIFDLDIIEMVGKNHSYDVYYNAEVTDAELNIEFNNASADQPKLSAIVVLSHGGIEPSIQEKLDQMSIEQKIGQMTMANVSSVTPQQAKENYIGALFNGGGGAPDQNTLEGWADRVEIYQEKAMENGMPIIYAMDAVHGMCELKGATVFPYNINIGCANNVNLAKKAARITAIETAACGVRWTFGPCVAVSRDDRWGRVYESFGEVPENNSRMSAAFIDGFQQGPFLHNTHSIAGCTKHFIADGGTVWGTGAIDENMGNIQMVDRGVASYTETDLRKLFLPPYRKAIEQNLASLMVSFSMWEDPNSGAKVDCIQSEFLLTDLLKDELGFKGVVITDWDGIIWPDADLEIYDNGAVYTKDNIKTAIRAGVDMAMVANAWQSYIQLLKDIVAEDPSFEDYITESVRRILRLKYRLNLFDNPYPDRSRHEIVGSGAHRKLSRQCVRESMVLLKNTGALPLSKNAKIALVGEWADDIGYQVGGWSLDWLGTMGNQNYPGGQSIKNAFEEAIKNYPGEVTYYQDGTGIGDDEDVIVVAIGEETYAEWKGDREIPEVSQAHKDLVALCASYSKPVVCVLLSGRPILIGQDEDDGVIGDCDAFIAAWLPGTEGLGITDVLFGDYNPTGRLTFSWPKSAAQMASTINIGDAVYDPLFEYGFGLDYYSPISGGDYDEWEVGIFYPVGAKVSYNGSNWENTFAHTSQVDWYPGAPGLWFWVEID